MNGIEIQPELIFVIILPPLLYEAAWNTSWKDFWKWRRVISSFAFPVVILTSCVVAFVSSSFIPGFTLAAGFLLGGIVSPPDAVSASAILKNIKVPKRFIAIVEGESLMNDASSLVIFRFALSDPDLTITKEQQRQLVRKKIAHLSLKVLDEDYAAHTENNDMVKALRLRFSADLELLKDWEKDDNELRADAYYKDYRQIMARLLKEQRALLQELNKKENISDELVKEQFELLDLEEEKLRRHFERAD